jgi:hypothetical protein
MIIDEIMVVQKQDMFVPGRPVQKHKDVLFLDDHNFINNHHDNHPQT